MDIFDKTFLNNSLQQWGVAAIAITGVFLFLWLARGYLGLRLRRTLGPSSPTWQKIAEALIGKTNLVLIGVLSLGVGVLFLNLDPEWRGLLRSASIIALILQGAVWMSALTSLWLREYQEVKLKTDPGAATTVGAIGFMMRLGLWTIVLLTVLGTLNVDITALVAGLGIGGIAVALAAQNILSDLFSSLSIVLDKPFAVGDFIVVNDLMGTVEYVGIKTTRLRSLSGEQLIFTNSDLLTSRIRNYKRMQERRATFTFGVVYETPAEKLERVPAMVQEIVASQPKTRFDRAHFKSFGESSLDFEVSYFVLSGDYTAYMDTQQAINLALFRRFEKERLDFAYPTRTVYHIGAPVVK